MRLGWRPLDDRTCAVCEATFAPQSAKTVVCGAECRTIRLRAQQRRAVAKWNAENAEQVRQTSREWFRINRDRQLALAKAWREANRDKERQRSSRYRARKHAALVHDLPEETIWEFNPAGPGCCNYCRAPLDFDNRASWQIDHVIPLSRGGMHELSNLVVACPLCNQSKGAKLLSEWNPRAA